MSPRQKSKSARDHYMVADFSLDDRERILKYCQRKGTSVSSFLADIALQEVRTSNKKRTTEEITITLKIPREQSAKLQMFARRQNKTPDQFCQDVLLPMLTKERTSFSSKTETLRYYVSAEQHRLLKKYLKTKNLSGRTYISFLALQALNRQK
jgi:hypothetical protein